MANFDTKVGEILNQCDFARIRGSLLKKPPCWGGFFNDGEYIVLFDFFEVHVGNFTVVGFLSAGCGIIGSCLLTLLL